jgi:hypothetical protein
MVEIRTTLRILYAPSFSGFEERHRTVLILSEAPRLHRFTPIVGFGLGGYCSILTTFEKAPWTPPPKLNDRLMPAMGSKYTEIRIACDSPFYILPVEDLTHGELDFCEIRS